VNAFNRVMSLLYFGALWPSDSGSDRHITQMMKMIRICWKIAGCPACQSQGQNLVHWATKGHTVGKLLPQNFQTFAFGDRPKHD